MNVVEFLENSGGHASRRRIVRVCGRAALRAALDSGVIVRRRRGHFALPVDDTAQVLAQEAAGVAVLLSAAAHWGWAVKRPTHRPQIVLPRGRNLRADLRGRIEPSWRALPADQVSDGWVTMPAWTVLDCAIRLPHDEALCVADSALRSGRTSTQELMRLVAQLPRQHRRRALRVVEAADGRSAGPFESVLRALCSDVPGLEVSPQIHIQDRWGWVGRVDLADCALRIVVEADSWEFHGGRADWARDVTRYSRLTAAGWLVLRFTWVEVMERPEHVRQVLAEAVAQRRRLCRRCAARPAGSTEDQEHEIWADHA